MDDTMLTTIDISDRSNLKILNVLPTPYYGGGHLTIAGDRLLMGLWSYGFNLYDISDGSGTPKLERSVTFRGYPKKMVYLDSTLVVPSHFRMNRYPVSSRTAPDQWKQGMTTLSTPDTLYFDLLYANGVQWATAKVGGVPMLLYTRDHSTKGIPLRKTGDIQIDRTYLYIIGDSIEALDFTELPPISLGMLNVPEFRSSSVSISNGKMVIVESGRKGKIVLYDISDPRKISRLGESDAVESSDVKGTLLKSDRLYLSSYHKLITLDISTPSAMKEIHRINTFGGDQPYIYESYLFSPSCFTGWITVVDISKTPPQEITWIHTPSTSTYAECLVINNNLLVKSNSNISYIPLNKMGRMSKLQRQFLWMKFWIDGGWEHTKRGIDWMLNG